MAKRILADLDHRIARIDTRLFSMLSLPGVTIAVMRGGCCAVRAQRVALPAKPGA